MQAGLLYFQYSLNQQRNSDYSLILSQLYILDCNFAQPPSHTKEVVAGIVFIVLAIIVLCFAIYYFVEFCKSRRPAQVERLEGLLGIDSDL